MLILKRFLGWGNVAFVVIDIVKIIITNDPFWLILLLANTLAAVMSLYEDIGVLLLWAVCTALLAIPIMIKGVSIVGVFIASAIIWIILFPLIILAQYAIDLMFD